MGHAHIKAFFVLEFLKKNNNNLSRRTIWPASAEKKTRENGEKNVHLSYMSMLA